LKENGYVMHEKYSYVNLTSKGVKAAKDIKRRQDVLIRFLTKVLNINKETALKDARNIKNAISSTTYERLHKLTSCYANKNLLKS
jgi:Mn-dependent DtxR family transcriptional regulator